MNARSRLLIPDLGLEKCDDQGPRPALDDLNPLDEGPDPGLEGEFLAQLPDQGLALALAGLKFPAGKLPPTSVRSPFGPPADEIALAPADQRRAHAQRNLDAVDAQGPPVQARIRSPSARAIRALPRSPKW